MPAPPAAPPAPPAAPPAPPAAPPAIPKVRTGGIPLVSPWLRFREAPLAYLSEAARQRGPVVDLALGPGRHVGVFGPDETAAVLTAPKHVIDEASPGRAYLARLFGAGVANAGGDVHRRHRTAVMRAFATRYLPIYQHLLHDAIASFLSRLALDRPIDLVPVLEQLYQHVTVKLLFGRALDAPLRRAIDTLIAVGRSTLDANLAPLLPWNVAGVVHGRDHRDALTAIDQALERLEHEDVTGLGKVLFAVTRPDLERRELRDNVLQLFMAGADTVSCAMMWTLLAIASHPEVRARLEAELDAQLAGRPPQLEDFDRLPFLDATLKESLRLYPTSPFGVRYALAPTTVGGHQLPRGTALIYSPWVTHRLASLYPDPERFDPDRFVQRPAPALGAYVPFALGPHSCVGAQLAQMEIKTLVCLLLQRFELELVPGQHITASCGSHGTWRHTRPTPGIWVRLVPRR